MSHPGDFSPLAAATEGLRMMRREPMAVLYWVAVWALALAAVGGVEAFVGGTPAPAGAARNARSLVRSVGPLAPVLVPVLLALWVMNTATIYRAVLRPGEHGWHLFKLGADEARIAVVGLAGTLLVALCGSLPRAFLLQLIFRPMFQAAPNLSQFIAIAGFLATVSLEIWIAVRLSLAPAETFAEKGFPVAVYWPLTRHHFWQLFATYLIVVVEILVFLLLFALVGVVFGGVVGSALGC